MPGAPAPGPSPCWLDQICGSVSQLPVLFRPSVTVAELQVQPLAQFAASLGMQYNIPNMNGSNLRLIGFYNSGDNAYGIARFPGALIGSAEWSVLASYNHVFSNTFSASVGFQYNADHYGAFTDVNTGVDSWATELSMVWTPVRNFEVRSELAYQNVDIPGADATFSGYVRFTRYF